MSALDVSDNYLRNYPQYAVSIALVSRGEARLSAVYDPVRNEFFGALLGCGAVLNGQPIQCAGAPAEGSRKAATGFHDPASTGLASYMGELGRVTRAFGPVRRSRCRALQLAHLAAGRIDAFWEHEVQPLAAMAGSLLVSESGGAVQARHAGKGEGRGSSVVASRSDLFHAFTGLLMPAT